MKSLTPEDQVRAREARAVRGVPLMSSPECMGGHGFPCLFGSENAAGGVRNSIFRILRIELFQILENKKANERFAKHDDMRTNRSLF